MKGESGEDEGREGKAGSTINDVLDINIFKNIEKGGDNKFGNVYSPNETEVIDVDDLEQTRKRKCLFEGLLILSTFNRAMKPLDVLLMLKSPV